MPAPDKIFGMASPTTPPEDPDDWGTPERAPGRWEDDEDASSARKRWSGALNAVFGPLWNDPRGRPLLLVSGLALLGICALSCFILSLVLLSERPGPFPPGPEIAEATRPSVTDEPTARASDALVIRVNDVIQPAPAPSRLTIGVSTYRLVPMNVQGARWQYDPGAQKTAFWVPGTLVNYVVGLHASPENREVVESLSVGDLILLDTNLGTQRYRVAQKETIRSDDVETLLAQNSPRLTLVLLGEGGDQRRIVIATFTDESTPNQLTAIGTPINLGDVRVRVINQRLLPGSAVGLPAGKSYVQVDFEVTNVVTRILDASQFFSEIADVAGVVIPFSRQASAAAGGRGFPQGALQPGQTITATAGFEVPDALSGPNLEWRFSLDKTSPYIAKVAIPYRPIALPPTPAPTRAPVAEVTILNAQISPEGNELRIVGNVRNLTGQFLSGSLRDVSLSGPDGQLYPLNSSLPAFPWNITPGETLVFQLSFARPQTSQPVVFTLFGQSYRICEPAQPCD
ncbi:MAG: hypothetical protein D6709_11605 [Chloroflexi bacterium]|jgi:hypothetical protein|uniref:DUF4352 domain-containing protein n=2 Tax=Candidatus Thermofonsia Clade 3 TaxID=2364209 RepID=A0A2M8QBP4_9CHLR|nr:MAG: hypothetical protein CUN48_09830 [Candidatus Thermofonsia Clade 3 bacterium]RMG62459.1 MAG: hypothetical protein D6709_11605 [Chloroflexota bacterium]